MSLTGRPLSPPLALTSSSQIFIASSDIFPLAASGPVSAMPKPIVIGLPCCASAAEHASVATAIAPPIRTNRFISLLMPSLPLCAIGWRIVGLTPRLAPHLLCQRDDHFKLRPLLVFRQNIAFLARGEAALRAQGQLVDIDIARGLVDTSLDVIPRFQLAALGRHQAEHHRLDLGHEAQRLEPAGALSVVFHEIAVHVDGVEQEL